MMTDMQRRTAAAQAAVDRFKGKPLKFGRHDCARMAALVLRRMGHEPKLAKAGTYQSALGAARALRKYGHETLADALDAIGLERIPPACRLNGDIVMLPGDGPFGGALTIAVGNERLLGWIDGSNVAEILQPLEFSAAWRV